MTKDWRKITKEYAYENDIDIEFYKHGGHTPNCYCSNTESVKDKIWIVSIKEDCECNYCDRIWRPVSYFSNEKDACNEMCRLNDLIRPTFEEKHTVYSFHEVTRGKIK